MQFGYTIIYVENTEAMASFFKQAFDMRVKFFTAEKDYVELDSGSTTLAFASHSLGNIMRGGDYIKTGFDRPSLGFEIGLETDNVEQAYRRAIYTGARSLSKPQKMQWGQTVAYIAGPENVVVGIGTPIPPRQ